MFTVERYRKTRFWAVYESGELVCVTVYKKGANAVKQRLERQDGRSTGRSDTGRGGELTLTSRNAHLSAQMSIAVCRLHRKSLSKRG